MREEDEAKRLADIAEFGEKVRELLIRWGCADAIPEEQLITVAEAYDQLPGMALALARVLERKEKEKFGGVQ